MRILGTLQATESTQIKSFITPLLGELNLVLKKRVGGFVLIFVLLNSGAKGIMCGTQSPFGGGFSEVQVPT